MCKDSMVCHGDKHMKFKDAYTDEQIAQYPKNCEPAVFYITNDGEYAVDADFITEDHLNDINKIDLASVPRIKLK